MGVFGRSGACIGQSKTRSEYFPGIDPRFTYSRRVLVLATSHQDLSIPRILYRREAATANERRISPFDCRRFVAAEMRAMNKIRTAPGIFVAGLSLPMLTKMPGQAFISMFEGCKMHRIVVLFFVASLSFSLPCSPSWAANDDPPETADVIAQAGAWVKRLADDRFATRELATSKLIELGIAARPALRAGAAAADREVRFRCNRILAVIEDVDFQRRLAAFAAGMDDAGTDLPGWNRFRDLYGSDGEARALFVAMQRSEPEVMKAIEHGPQGVSRVVDMRCAEIQQTQRILKQPVELGQIAALLFAAGDAEINFDAQSGSALYSFCFQDSFTDAIENSAKKKLLRSLLGAWVERSESWTAYQCLSLAMRYDLKEGLVPAVKVISAPGNQPYLRQNGILAIAKLGDDRHKPLLEELLSDQSHCASQRVNNKNYITQLRDVALAALMIMNKQDPKEFGFDRIQLNETTMFVTSTVGFENDEQRQQVFDKWRKQQAGKSESSETKESE